MVNLKLPKIHQYLTYILNNNNKNKKNKKMNKKILKKQRFLILASIVFSKNPQKISFLIKIMTKKIFNINDQNLKKLNNKKILKNYSIFYLYKINKIR